MFHNSLSVIVNYAVEKNRLEFFPQLKNRMITYPRLLDDDRRFSIFAESFAPIMHQASIVIWTSQRVYCSTVVLFEIMTLT